MVFKWFKYTKIAVEMDELFRNIYNFHLPQENRTQNYLYLLGMTVVFETSRNHQFHPDDMTYLLKRLDPKNNALVQFVNPTGVSELVEWDAYERAYTSYNNFRAKGIRPAVATMLGYMSQDANVTQDVIDEYNVEYERVPVFGYESGL
jgi:hypothetical protein